MLKQSSSTIFIIFLYLKLKESDNENLHEICRSVINKHLTNYVNPQLS